MNKAELSKRELPDCPGVYLFTKGRGRGKKVLYVGKASSLRDRVRSYFDGDLLATRGPCIVDMVTASDSVEYETTPTVLEALVREAALIKQYAPKANAEGKDDKTFLYAVVTNEAWPRVLTVRGKDIDFKAKRTEGLAIKAHFGPFPSGRELKEALRLIRRIFPFFDTPKPIHEGGKHQQARMEFNRQIGQYPTTLNKKEYLRSMRNVSFFLSGRVKTLRQKLTKDMNAFAKSERFEEAHIAKRQLFALDHVQDVSLIKEDRGASGGIEDARRIEAYDTAHIGGTNAIGVLTVVTSGIPDRREYRTFRIRANNGKKANDDIASLKEILSRRLTHPEWPYPKAIVVDGGKTHKKAAEAVLLEAGVSIPVIAVVKDEKHRPREIIGALRGRISEADAVLANAEAHRFSLQKHRQARRRALQLQVVKKQKKTT